MHVVTLILFTDDQPLLMHETLGCQPSASCELTRLGMTYTGQSYIVHRVVKWDFNFHTCENYPQGHQLSTFGGGGNKIGKKGGIL